MQIVDGLEVPPSIFGATEIRFGVFHERILIDVILVRNYIPRLQT